VAHHRLGLLLEHLAAPQHEGAVGDEAVERIADEGELEIVGEGLFAQVRAHLAQGQMAMLDRRQIRPREAFVDEQTHLLDVRLAQLLAQGLTHGMGAGLGHGGEDETMGVGDDHVSAHTKNAPLP
jgi:hypothetical protein